MLSQIFVFIDKKYTQHDRHHSHIYSKQYTIYITYASIALHIGLHKLLELNQSRKPNI